MPDISNFVVEENAEPFHTDDVEDYLACSKDLSRADSTPILLPKELEHLALITKDLEASISSNDDLSLPAMCHSLAWLSQTPSSAIIHKWPDFPLMDRIACGVSRGCTSL